MLKKKPHKIKNQVLWHRERGRKEKAAGDGSLCLFGLGLFLSDRLMLTTQGREAAEKNQRGTGEPGLLWALKCPNSMQQSSTG